MSCAVCYGYPGCPCCSEEIDEEVYAVCVNCSENISTGEEVHIYADKYCCEDCIINEMQEEGKTRDKAIDTYKQFVLKYRRW